MQTIREFGANVWNRPWLSGLLYALNRLHLGFTYFAISAAMMTVHRFLGKTRLRRADH